MVYTNNVPQALLNEFKNENVILFVGSGLSYSAGLPSWDGLLNMLKEYFMISEENVFTSMTELMQAQYLYDRVGKSSIVKYIEEIFNKQKKSYSESHDILVHLPVKTIITTNWDCLIEEYYKKNYNIELKKIIYDKDLPFSINKPKLIKIHGDINYSDSIVFSENDYLNFIYSDTLLKHYISASIATSTILFIGYSFSDFDLKILYNYVLNKLFPLTNQAYIFIPEKPDFTKLFYQDQYFSNKKINIIYYNNKENNKSKSTLTFLNELIENVAITANKPLDRLKIIRRENSKILKNIDKKKHIDFVIKNKSNLGPLATPEKIKSKNLFGNDREATKLENEIANNWRKILNTDGVKAECIISLDESRLLKKSSVENMKNLERLKTLKSNIIKFKKKIVVVDKEIFSEINIDIYNREICLKSQKESGSNIGEYKRINAIFDENQINNEILYFNEMFTYFKEENLKKARIELHCNKEGNELLFEYIIYKIDKMIFKYNEYLEK